MASEDSITVEQYIYQLVRCTPFALLDQVHADKNDPKLKVVAYQYATLFMVSFRRMMHELSKSSSNVTNLLAILPNSVIVAQEIGPISEGLKSLHNKANVDSASANQHVLHFRMLESLVHEIQQSILDGSRGATSSNETTAEPEGHNDLDESAVKVPTSPIVPFNSDEPAEIYTGEMPASH